MPKVEIEEYNYFICPECDKDGTNRLSPEEFQKHLIDVHGIHAKGGKRSMLSHLDGAGWFAWNYEWTIGGKTFTQHTKQKRSHKFGAALFSIIIIAMLLVFSAPAHAGDKWDNTDLSLLAASTVLFAADWQQTRYIARNPDKYEETNPLYSKHPNTQSVDLTIAGIYLATVVIAELLPSKWRKIWLGGVIVIEGKAVIHNVGIGIRF